MNFKIFGIFCLLLSLVGILYALSETASPITYTSKSIPSRTTTSTTTTSIPVVAAPKPATAISASTVVDIPTESFDDDYTVEEAGSIETSDNSLWWLSSGAYFYSSNGLGSTVIGSLPTNDPWRIAFAKSNPIDTDNGFYPQNIFRLVFKSKWLDYIQQAYFKIEEDHLSPSQNRNSSNGLLLFNRYQDEFNLYYTGIRVDGYVTIKKKVDGIYYTLAYEPFIFDTKYNRDVNPNLLPKDTWIGLRSEVKTNLDGTVEIKLYIDKGKTGNWSFAVGAIDDGENFGGAVLGEGYAGIRTDFMDVLFDDFKIKALEPS